MKKYLFIAAALLTLASCDSLKDEFQPVFTGEYDPSYGIWGVTMTPTNTIAELASMYKTESPMTFTKDVIISGVISTTDQPGNFYKSFFIQDETGGMEIKIGKNGLYNDYKEGQRIYVNCNDLTLGMYGYKSGTAYGNGMVQIGFSDPTGEYETSYLESQLLIDKHVFKGAVESKVTPVVLSESDLPKSSSTQATNHNLGKLVTINNLTYGWTNTTYNENNEAFVLLYLDSNKDKKLSSNRIFVSGEGTGITTWAMSKNKMKSYLLSGIWDDVSIGNANDYNYGTVGDHKGDGSYPDIEKAAGSVSQYFHTEGGTCVQIRTSGYAKFADTEIPASVLAKRQTINVTGVMCLYQGKIQITVNSLDDITFN